MNNDSDGPNNKGVAFALWLAWVFGLFGIHRFYLGRPGTGLLYLFTFGLFGIGQFVDLLRLPAMVNEENTKAAAFRALAEKRALQAQAHLQLPPAQLYEEEHQHALPPHEADSPQKFRVKLVQAAAKYGGHLTVTQGVLETGRTFEEVEAELDSMAKSGYVGIDNDENTGAVIYTFGELDPKNHA